MMRTKPDYWYRQSAVIPFRWNNKELEILIITSRKKKKWIIPKGIVEENLSPFESAQKEALEEAGVTGNGTGKLVGKYKYKKWGGKCRVEVFSLEVETINKEWPENFRERKWVKFNELNKYIKSKKLMKILHVFFKFRKDIINNKNV